MEQFRKIIGMLRKVSTVLFYISVFTEVVELVNERVENKFGNKKVNNDAE